MLFTIPSTLLVLATASLIQASSPFELELLNRREITNLTIFGVPCKVSDRLIKCLDDANIIAESFTNTCEAPENVTPETIPACACQFFVAEARCAFDYCPDAYTTVERAAPKCFDGTVPTRPRRTESTTVAPVTITLALGDPVMQTTTSSPSPSSTPAAKTQPADTQPAVPALKPNSAVSTSTVMASIWISVVGVFVFM
ncbi:hypothetical protein HDU97_000939 [Phlyctochytrium planicorne]|nr:hypothetical protein HDU97_000939 [Phlyctochytrium planicorne]